MTANGLVKAQSGNLPKIDACMTSVEVKGVKAARDPANPLKLLQQDLEQLRSRSNTKLMDDQKSYSIDQQDI